MDYLKTNLSDINKIYYFSDGCTVHYKNYKNFLNLCYHKEDFEMTAEWVFFATSHSKTACDGIGGTVKRTTARASLQRPLDQQILNVNAMFEFCIGKIGTITFYKITKDAAILTQQQLKENFDIGKQSQAQEVTTITNPFQLLKCFKRTSEHDFVDRFILSKVAAVSGPDVVAMPNLNDFVPLRLVSNWGRGQGQGRG